MQRVHYVIATILLLPALSGCQYFSYFKTNTMAYPGTQAYSPETTCAAMGAERGNALLDWCIAEEEEARAARQQ